MPQYRAEFDATVTFLNGGGLNATGFRVDIEGPRATEAEVGALFVVSLGLLMVDRVEVSGLRIIEQEHKGTRTDSGAPDAAPAAARRRIVDLSHVITEGMTTFPGMPGPELLPYLTREESRSHYAAGTEFTIDRVSMLGNTGTYLDSPFHRYEGGTDLSGLELERLVDLPTVVVRVTDSGSRGVDVGALAALDVEGAAVLLHTGGDVAWGSDAYGEAAPFLTADGARWLVEHGAALVGIDSVNIDDMESGGERPAHSILLAAGIPIVEHLTALEQVPPSGARFSAAPPRFAGFGTFPVRAHAVVVDAARERHPLGSGQ